MNVLSYEFDKINYDTFWINIQNIEKIRFYHEGYKKFILPKEHIIPKEAIEILQYN